MNSKKRISAWAGAVRAAAFISSSSAVFGATSGDENGQNPPLSIKVDNAPIDRDPKLGNSFAPIVQKVIPSVVQINVTGKTSGGGKNLGGSDMQDQLRRVFRRQFPRIPEQRETPDERPLCTGVIISSDGYIL